jgi:CheY-like chemotaxis protein
MEGVNGKILLVDDEVFEYDLMRRALAKLGLDDKLIFFAQAAEAIDYIKTCGGDIFAIFSDLHMPLINGMEFRQRIENDPLLKKKAIPFIFLSSSASRTEVEKAYQINVQGYFSKPAELKGLIEILKTVVDYWSKVRHPNNC